MHSTSATLDRPLHAPVTASPDTEKKVGVVASGQPIVNQRVIYSLGNTKDALGRYATLLQTKDSPEGIDGCTQAVADFNPLKNAIEANNLEDAQTAGLKIVDELTGAADASRKSSFLGIPEGEREQLEVAASQSRIFAQTIANKRWNQAQGDSQVDPRSSMDTKVLGFDTKSQYLAYIAGNVSHAVAFMPHFCGGQPRTDWASRA